MDHIKCIIVGGPQHGMIVRRAWDRGSAPQLSVVAADGERCAAAARRRDHATGTHYLLLHPRATGEQFLTMLAA